MLKASDPTLAEQLVGRCYEGYRDRDCDGKKSRDCTMKSHIIAPLTSIRGFAAIFVVMYHIKDRLGDFAIQEYIPALSYGWLGVDFFFVLSGFILSYVYMPLLRRSGFSMFDFLSARLARIYPVHFATIIIWIGLGAWSGFLWSSERFGVEGLVANVTLVQSWHVLPENTWNFPAWSISAEWFAYLLFPILALAANRLRSHWFLDATLVVLLIVSLQAFTEILPGRKFNWSYDWGNVRVVLEFTAGIFLYRIHERLNQSYVWDIVGTASIVTIAALLTIKPAIPLIQVETLVVLLAALTILALSRMQGLARRVLSMAPLTYLGRISYSMYMWHAAPLFVITRYIRRNFEGELSFEQGATVFLVYLTLVMLGAVLLYHFVEKPMQRVLRRQGA